MSRKFVSKKHIDNIPSLVQIIVSCLVGDKPLSQPTMVSLLTHICVTLLHVLSVDYNCVCLMPFEWLMVVHLIKSCRTSSHNLWYFRSLQFILTSNIRINFWLNIRNIIFVVCVVKIGMRDLYPIGSIYSTSTSSMVWLLMTWFLVSLGHQQPWQSKWEIWRSLITTKNDFVSLSYFSALGNGENFSTYIQIIRFAKGQYIHFDNFKSKYESIIVILFQLMCVDFIL